MLNAERKLIQNPLGMKAPVQQNNQLVKQEDVASGLLENINAIHKKNFALKNAIDYSASYSRKGFMEKVLSVKTPFDIFGKNVEIDSVNAILKDAKVPLELSPYTDIPYSSGRNAVEQSLSIATAYNAIEALNNAYVSAINGGDYRTATQALDQIKQISSINFYSDGIDHRTLQYLMYNASESAALGSISPDINRETINKVMHSTQESTADKMFKYIDAGYYSPLVDFGRNLIGANYRDLRALSRTDFKMQKLSDRDRVVSSFMGQGGLAMAMTLAFPFSPFTNKIYNALMGFAIQKGIGTISSVVGEAYGSAYGETSNQKESLSQQVSSWSNVALNMMRAGASSYIKNRGSDLLNKKIDYFTSKYPSNDGDVQVQQVDIYRPNNSPKGNAFDWSMTSDTTAIGTTNIPSIPNQVGSFIKKIAVDLAVLDKDALNSTSDIAKRVIDKFSLQKIQANSIPAALAKYAENNIVSPLAFSMNPYTASSVFKLSSASPIAELTSESIKTNSNIAGANAIRSYIDQRLTSVTLPIYETTIEHFNTAKSMITDKFTEFYTTIAEEGNRFAQRLPTHNVSSAINTSIGHLKSLVKNISTYVSGNKEQDPAIRKSESLLIDNINASINHLSREESFISKGITYLDDADVIGFVPNLFKAFQNVITILKDTKRDLVDNKRHGVYSSASANPIDETTFNIESQMSLLFGHPATMLKKHVDSEYSMYMEGGSGLYKLLNMLEDVKKGNFTALSQAHIRKIDTFALSSLNDFMLKRGIDTEELDNGIKMLTVSYFNQKYSNADGSIKPFVFQNQYPKDALLHNLLRLILGSTHDIDAMRDWMENINASFSNIQNFSRTAATLQALRKEYPTIGVALDYTDEVSQFIQGDDSYVLLQKLIYDKSVCDAIMLLLLEE